MLQIYRSIGRASALTLAGALALGCSAGYSPPPATADEVATRSLDAREVDAFFAWYRSLGYPSVAGKPLVEVDGARSGDEESDIGFLMDSNAWGFVVAHGLEPITYSYGEAASIARARPPAFTVLATGRALGARLESWAPRESERGLPVFLFYLARAAHDNGLADEARRLLAHAVRALDGPEPGDGTATLREAIGRALLRRFFEDHGRAPLLSLGALRERLLWFSARFDGDVGRHARELAGIVERMIAEQHRPPAPDFVTARVQAAINALGDDRGCNDAIAAEESARSRLRRMGHSAVPALIELWDDDRVMPCLDRRPQQDLPGQARWKTIAGRPMPELQRYRDAARAILAQGAPRTLTTRAEAEAWWQETRSWGTLDAALAVPAMLREAKAHVSVDGARGIPAIIAAAKRAEGSIRLALTGLLADLPGDDQRSFLADELRSGLILEARVEAARGLAQRGDATWAAALIHAVEERNARLTSSTVEAGKPRPNVLSPAMVKLILERAGPGDHRAFTGLYPRLPLDDRIVLLGVAAGHVGPADAAVGDLLLTALDDLATVAEGDLRMRGARCWRWRPRDMAAIEIAYRLKTTYDCKAPHEVTSRAIARLKVEWIKKRRVETVTR